MGEGGLIKPAFINNRIYNEAAEELATCEDAGIALNNASLYTGKFHTGGRPTLIKVNGKIYPFPDAQHAGLVFFKVGDTFQFLV